MSTAAASTAATAAESASASSSCLRADSQSLSREHPTHHLLHLDNRVLLTSQITIQIHVASFVVQARFGSLQPGGRGCTSSTAIETNGAGCSRAFIMQSFPECINLCFQQCDLTTLLIHFIIQLQDDFLRFLRVQLVCVQLRFQRGDQIVLLQRGMLGGVLQAVADFAILVAQSAVLLFEIEEFRLRRSCGSQIVDLGDLCAELLLVCAESISQVDDQRVLLFDVCSLSL